MDFSYCPSTFGLTFPSESAPELHHGRVRVPKLPNTIINMPTAETFCGPRTQKSNLNSKPASEWKKKDLTTLLVDMVPMSIEQFFGCHESDLPEPTFTHPHFKETLEAACPPFEDGNKLKDRAIISLFNRIARACGSSTEPIVDHIATDIMRMMEYEFLNPNGNFCGIEPQHEMHFEMSEQNTCAKVDLALVDSSQALLCLFVEDKRLSPSYNTSYTGTATAALPFPHAQIIAHALGAYNTNMVDGRQGARPNAPDNESSHSLANDHFDMVIPAFSLVGTVPCFYIIPITASFSSAVARGEIPPHPTKVFFCVAPVQAPAYGMMLKRQHILILKMFEGFKRFIPTDYGQLCRFSKLGAAVPKPFDPEFKANVWNWVQFFLWECKGWLQEKGFTQEEYASGCINYYYGYSSMHGAPNFVSVVPKATGYPVRIALYYQSLLQDDSDSQGHSKSVPAVPQLPVGYPVGNTLRHKPLVQIEYEDSE